MFFIFTPLLTNTPTGQTAHQIFMLNGSIDADSCKDVPFLALLDIAAHLWDQIAQKNTILWACVGIFFSFSAKLPNIEIFVL